MEATRGVRVVEISGARRERTWATVPSVHFYDLYVNGKHVAELKAMPASLRELAVGFLLTNGYVSDHHILERVDVSADRIDVVADSEFDFQYQYWKEKGVTPLDEIRLSRLRNGYTIPRERLFERIEQGFRRAVFYSEIGGTAFALLADDNGHTFIAEDVYPEAAIYKAVGKAVLVNFDMRRSFLFVSGCLLPEFVVYSAVLGIPVVGAYLGVPSLSIDIAENVTGQTLFQWDGERLRVFASPARII
ncbi:TPA: hypothetical protein EYP13_00390 [Candidatus Micrarchaeota archaeon]|nr:hypothetical protein [Candidatus Micrarchaeota archaeon]